MAGKNEFKGWYVERFMERGGTAVKLEKKLFSKKTKFQQLDIYSSALGNLMVLDGCIMLTDQAEASYHEMLVHVPMNACKAPESVCIIGGGDGGTMREVLKYKSVKRAVMCEIDEEVVIRSREYFPGLIAWEGKDRRAQVVIGDGAAFVKEHKGEFDVVLVDSTDPVGPASVLFSTAFYNDVKASLKKGGIVATQAESPWYSLELALDAMKLLGKTFKHVNYYTSAIPMYPSGFWGFAIASNDVAGFDKPLDLAAIKPFEKNLRHYNPALHGASFCRPSFLNKALGKLVK